MLTKKDRQQLVQDFKEVFVTKDDLKNELKDLASKNDLVKFKVEILGEITKLREDSTIDTGVRDQVEDHDRRLENLELIHPQGKHP